MDITLCRGVIGWHEQTTWTPLKPMANSSAPDRIAVSAPLVTPVVLFLFMSTLKESTKEQ
jgi:hypothetical protein